ncbi:MAG: ATPase [Desulfobacterales bacterium]
MVNVDGSVVVQIVNFIFLIWILNLVLYKPIRKIILQRKEKVKRLELDIEALKTGEDEKNDSFTTGINEARAKGLKAKEIILLNSAEEGKRIIENVNEQIRTDLSDVRGKIEKEIENVRQTLEKEVDDFADSIGKKILGRAVS